jgi:uncharacterized membrane protein YoaK (UPF0700 family)
MGKQYVKFRTKIHCSIPFILLIVLLHSLSIWALLDEVWLVALALGLLSCSILLKFLSDTAQSSYLLSQVFLDLKAQNASPTPQPEAAYATSSEQTEEQLESIIAHH